MTIIYSLGLDLSDYNIPRGGFFYRSCSCATSTSLNDMLKLSESVFMVPGTYTGDEE